MRKANETVQPRQRILTPQEWSDLKFERERKQKQQIEQAKVGILKANSKLRLTLYNRLLTHKSKWANNKLDQAFFTVGVIL